MSKKGNPKTHPAEPTRGARADRPPRDSTRRLTVDRRDWSEAIIPEGSNAGGAWGRAGESPRRERRDRERRSSTRERELDRRVDRERERDLDRPCEREGERD